MNCPLSEYCSKIRSPETAKMDYGNFGLFTLALQSAVNINNTPARECYTADKTCALRPKVWEELGYDQTQQYLLSLATESMGDV